MKTLIFDVVSLVFLIVGSICGAGLISGSEIWLFFAKYGESALILGIVFALIFYVSIKKVFALKIKYNLKSIDDLSVLIFPKFPSLIKYFFYLIFLFFGSAMLAGLSAVSQWLLWIGGLFAIGIVLFNKNSISWLNLVLIPLIFIYIIGLSVFNMDFLGFTALYKTTIFSFVQVIYYASINFLLVISYILQRNITDKKHINLVAICSSLLCFMCIIFISLIISNISSLLSPMPLFDFAKGNIYLNIISTPVLFVSIFTTLLGCLYSLSLDFKYKPIIKFIHIIFAFLIMLLISLLGLTKVLTYGYSFIGFMGFSIILIIWFMK